MKLEYIGCCFRFELEVFQRNLELRKYRVVRHREIFELKSRLLRRIKPRLEELRCRFPAN